MTLGISTMQVILLSFRFLLLQIVEGATVRRLA